MSRDRCCVPGCFKSGNSHSVLHGFPNPEKNPELFRSWIYAVGGDILGLDNLYIYKLRRVCHAHFVQKYCCRFNRISKIAVPTINLPGQSIIPNYSEHAYCERNQNVEESVPETVDTKCSESDLLGPLHHFPKLPNDKERFDAWKAVLNDDIQAKGDMYIYNQIRLCNKHFESYYKSPSNRLTGNAVPSLYIKKGGLLHIFPNPDKYPEQHREWVKIVNGRYDPNYDYKKYRVCDRHFTDRDRTRSSRLNVLAVPSMYLTGMPEYALKNLKTAKKKIDSPPKPTQTDNNISFKDLPDTKLLGSPKTNDQLQSSSIQIVAGVSGKIITKRVSSVIAPQLNLSSSEILTDFNMDDDNSRDDSADEMPTDGEEVMDEEYFLSQDNDNEAVMDQEYVTSPSHDDEEIIMEESSRAIIARVYNYLQTEYDYMTALVGDICDVSPLADILKRTAEATGVAEDTITAIVEESKSTEHHFNLDHITNSQQSLNEENDVTDETNDIKTDLVTDSEKKVHTIDLRTGKPIKISRESTEKLQAISKITALPVLRLIKPNFIIQSAVTEKQEKTNSSDILKNLSHCQWCVVREKGYNKSMRMCNQCKVSLCLDQSYRNLSNSAVK